MKYGSRQAWGALAAPVDGGRWDRVGIVASIACIVHCLAAPLLFLAAPKVAGVWAHPSSHAIVAVLALPLAGMVLFRGYRVHRSSWVAGAAALGAVLILVGSVLPFLGSVGESSGAGCAECCPQLIEDGAGGVRIGWPAASVVTVLGSLLLVGCHVGNLACCRCCRPGACS